MKKMGRYIIACIVTVLLFGVSGCGVSQKSPEKVTKSLIENYVKGKEKKVKQCYGQVKDTNKELQAEIDARIKYYQAHNAQKVKITACDILSEDKNDAYVYIIYNLILKNNQEYPCIGTYMTQKKDGKYYILPPSAITDDMRDQAVIDYKKFMTTDNYKNYKKAYDTFIKKNPGYEDKVAGKLR